MTACGQPCCISNSPLLLPNRRENMEKSRVCCSPPSNRWDGLVLVYWFILARQENADCVTLRFVIQIISTERAAEHLHSLWRCSTPQQASCYRVKMLNASRPAHVHSYQFHFSRQTPSSPKRLDAQRRAVSPPDD